jgi:hypothetical protein
MDRFLRELERGAGDPEDEERLAHARFRAGKCPKHGLDACENLDCIAFLEIVYALTKETDFYQKWGGVALALLTRVQQMFPPEISLREAFNDDIIRLLNREILSEAGYFLRIFFRTALAEEFIEQYKLVDTPYCGPDTLRFDGQRLREHLETLDPRPGWGLLVDTIYYPEWGSNPLLDSIDYKLVDEISKIIPPTELEQVLKRLPSLEADVAADLLEKARGALFLGKNWRGETAVSSGKNQRDWFRLGCQDYPNCYDQAFFINKPSFYQDAGRAFATGTPKKTFVQINRKEGSYNLKQRLGSDLVTVTISPELSCYREVRDAIKKAKNEGLRIKIDNGYKKQKPYRQNPWYDKHLTGDLYRGTTTGPLRSFGVGVMGAGVYLSWDKKIAETFAAAYADYYGGDPVITTYRIAPNLNILERMVDPAWDIIMREVGYEPYKKIKGASFSGLLSARLEELGYDGVVSSDPFDGLVIFDSKNVIGYTDPALCPKCHNRRVLCKLCGHLWCHTKCDEEFPECPNCSSCRNCFAEFDVCDDCYEPYCYECDGSCPSDC